MPWSDAEAETPHLEAISTDLADVLVFPSAYMMRWCKRHFPSPAPHLVIPNSLTGESRRFGRVPAGRRPVEKIVFFGRLELRKGIDRFLSAIELVLENGLSDFEVIFLGSLGQKLSEAELARRIEHWTCKTRLLLNYTTHEAVDLLRTDNCLAVMPSRVDNSPYTVYECLENGIPFIASDVGGIPELVRDEDKARVLVSGEAEEYAIRLRDALENGALPARPSFNPDQADLDLLSLHGNLAEAARLSRGRVSLAAATRTSVIVYGAREPDRALALVLRRWAQDGVEIFWHGDPSSAQSSGTNAFPFFTETRAAALNRLARSASGDHILFCHASVVPRTESLTAMLAALAGARADAIVCGYQTAGKNGAVEIVPIFGGTPELSATHNDYGAKLFLVRKARFLEGGGFATEPEIAEILEWEFLNRLKGPGGRVFAIPAAMASVIDPAQQPLLSEYQLGRLTAPWVESAPEPLQGFIRMALHQERNAGQPSAQPAANRKRATEDVAASPDVRGLELAGLLARRAQSHAGQTHSAPQDSATLSVGQKAGLASAALKNELVLANSTPNSAANGHGDSALAAIEGTWSEENELGRQGIGSDGRLLRPSTSYVIQAVEDAEGCDFLVADSVADVRQCRSVENTFREIEQQMARRAERSPAGNSFLRFEEVLAARPDAAALVVDAVRRATELTARFYGLTVPVYPTQVKIAQVGAGTFIMPRRPILVPRGVGSDAPQQDFAGLLCLSDDVEGGETYFTTIDIAVKPELGRYIGCTASPYHERAVLRVNSGTLLTLSFIMRSECRRHEPGAPAPLLSFPRPGAGGRHKTAVALAILARRPERFILALDLGGLRNPPHLRRARRHDLGANREDRAKGLVLLKSHPAWAQHLPVHRERIAKLIGVDDSGERGGIVLRAVERAGRQQVPPRIRPEDVVHIHGDDARGKIRLTKISRRSTARKRLQRRDRQIRHRGAAVPMDVDRNRTEDMPAVGIGDRHRQAAVDFPVRKVVHPPPVGTGRNQFRCIVVERVADEPCCRRVAPDIFVLLHWPFPRMRHWMAIYVSGRNADRATA